VYVCRGWGITVREENNIEIYRFSDSCPCPPGRVLCIDLAAS
jgi:hypothetical protein